MVIKGQLVDILKRSIYGVRISIENSNIITIEKTGENTGPYIMPGFIDAHVHVESSMLTPEEFGKLALKHGTVATISDPHEIANVLGLKGVEFMIENAKNTPLKIHFGAPSCVPATPFETAGAMLDDQDVSSLLARDDIWYLSEVMNFPGVLNQDPQLMAMIDTARRLDKPVDGHAPGLSGLEAERYIQSGIETDHECFTYEEALHKLKCGMKILIREGSAAKNYAALHPLIDEYPDKVMFCTDDSHPDDLFTGHINRIVVRAIADGHDLFHVLQAACLNPISHYKIPVGQLNIGDPADFLLVEDLEYFTVSSVFINGKRINPKSKNKSTPQSVINNFNRSKISIESIQTLVKGSVIRVIEAKDGELVTGHKFFNHHLPSGAKLESIEREDILKIAVVNRYNNTSPAIGFIRNTGIKNAAIASSVAHDAHNIVAVGTSDELLTKAINTIIEHNGGIAGCGPDWEKSIPLEIGGIMTRVDGEKVAKDYEVLNNLVKKKSSTSLKSPFMTLSFMALLVIPSLKLSDKGLFDGNMFEFVTLFES